MLNANKVFDLQRGSEMNIIGQKLFLFGGFVHNIKHIKECVGYGIMNTTGLCSCSPANLHGPECWLDTPLKQLLKVYRFI